MISSDSSKLPRGSPLGHLEEGHEVELNFYASDWRWHPSVPPEFMATGTRELMSLQRPGFVILSHSLE